MEVSGQLHAPATLLPGKSPPGTLWVGGWVGPRASLAAVKKRKILTLPGVKPSRPARSPSLYRLNYLDFISTSVNTLRGCRNG
jgi:hypothetical protein